MRLAGIVYICAYQFEYAAAYSGAAEADEEFGPTLTELAGLLPCSAMRGNYSEEVLDVKLAHTGEFTGEITSLLDLAIARSRANAFVDEEVKELIRGVLEGARQEIAHLEELLEESNRGADQHEGIDLPKSILSWFAP